MQQQIPPKQQQYFEHKDKEEIRKLKDEIYQLEILLLSLRKINKQLKDAMLTMREEITMMVNRGGILSDNNVLRDVEMFERNDLITFKNKHPLCVEFKEPLPPLNEGHHRYHPIYTAILNNIREYNEL